MKGQASTEFILVTALSALILVPIILYSISYLSSSPAGVAQARNAVNSLAEAANSICFQPVGARREVFVTIPRPVNLNASSFSGRTITLAIITADVRENVTANTRCQINGTMPPSTGSFNFRAKKLSSVVEFAFNTTS